MFKKILLVCTLLLCAMITASAQIHKWGEVSRLTVEGNHLVDSLGNQVMLHGVMDTPSPYFSGYRFTDYHWIDVYTQGDAYLTKCINYFDQLFTAVTDTTQSTWCNVFRLHLDPCWTDNPNVSATGFTTSNGKTYDPNGNEVSGEANIQHFDKSRLSKYLNYLYYRIAYKAKSHGMYVIMRPPGVCPNTIKVGDYYQQYLLTVWDVVTKNTNILNNSDWISIELANEPINIRDANGNDTKSAMHDFFQPIVDKIRENGFKGIIWVPGGTWQQNYRPYAKYPIIDPMLNEDGTSAQQIGYAVHWYPGWYSTSDSQYDNQTSINSFLDAVPVVKTSPIMITEVDWSPEDPTGTGHYNESGQWVVPNCGTWATGTTSKFGKAYRATIDYFGNIGWTLTHTHDFLDIDHYLSTKEVRPAFYEKLPNNAYEACSGACFQWYPEYAATVHQAREWEIIDANNIELQEEKTGDADKLDGKTFYATDIDTEAIWYVNESNNTPQNVYVGELKDYIDNPYCCLKFKKVTNAGCSTTGNLYTIQMATETGTNYNLYGGGGYLNTPPGTWCLFALGITAHKYGQDADYYGLWQVSYEAGSGYVIRNVGALQAGQNSYITPSAGTPQQSKCYTRLFGKIGTKTAIEDITADAEDTDVTMFDLMGRRIEAPSVGQIYIRNGKKCIIR